MQLPKDLDSLRTDRQGMGIVHKEFAITGDWEFRQIPGRDVGKDCELELVEDDCCTGLSYTVQVKSTKMLEKNKRTDDYSVSLDISTINYCLNKKVPFLILLVDVNTSDIYYLYVQEYLDLNLDIKKKLNSTQKTVNLRIPKRNLVKNNQEQLKKIVKR